jgi:membrane-associated protein
LATWQNGTVEEQAKLLGLRKRELIGLAIAVPLLVVLIVAAKPLVTDLLDKILHLNPTLVYVVVFALVFAEASIFFGFIFPGETAVILGGVVAKTGSVNVYLLASLVVVGAILGDSVGYFVGDRFGERVLNFKLLRTRMSGIETGLSLLRKRGALAVFIGRFTAFLRAVMPGLAGLSKMHYRTFLKANAAGGLIWGVGFTALGFVIGSAYQRAEKYAGWASTGLLIFILLVGVTLFVRGKLKEQKLEATNDGGATPDKVHQEIEKNRQSFDA